MAGGRPKQVIDYDMVEKLASIQCTQEEISSVLGISTRTLQKDDEFLRIYKKGIEYGRMSLRRLQFRAAEKGNVSMLIWLGKQHLNQREPIADSIVPEEEMMQDMKAYDK
jgi:hypothetical protein